MSARFARAKDDGPKAAARPAVEYLRVTKTQLEAGTVGGLKYTPPGGPKGDGVQGVLNYLGGQGWDAVFDGETLVCKRFAGGQTRWEFLVLADADPKRRDEFDPVLKTAGQEGWELSGFFDERRVAIFKRVLPLPKNAEPTSERMKEDPKREEYPSRPVIK